MGEIIISETHGTIVSAELSVKQSICHFNMSTKLSPNEMDMRMTMLGLMYAPSDRVTLMGMAMFEDKEIN